jgi:glutaredoxin 3
MSKHQSRVVLYTAPVCPYCVQAKRLLTHRGIDFQEIDVAADSEQRQIMVRKSGRRSVPQVFIDGEPIGGYEELAALDRQGGLAGLAGQSGSP